MQVHPTILVKKILLQVNRSQASLRVVTQISRLNLVAASLKCDLVHPGFLCKFLHVSSYCMPSNVIFVLYMNQGWVRLGTFRYHQIPVSGRNHIGWLSVRFESTQHKRGVNWVVTDFRNFHQTGSGTVWRGCLELYTKHCAASNH